MLSIKFNIQDFEKRGKRQNHAVINNDRQILRCNGWLKSLQLIGTDASLSFSLLSTIEAKSKICVRQISLNKTQVKIFQIREIPVSDFFIELTTSWNKIYIKHWSMKKWNWKSQVSNNLTSITYSKPSDYLIEHIVYVANKQHLSVF